jgi:hypothetical protein
MPGKSDNAAIVVSVAGAMENQRTAYRGDGLFDSGDCLRITSL